MDLKNLIQKAEKNVIIGGIVAFGTLIGFWALLTFVIISIVKILNAIF